MSRHRLSNRSAPPRASSGASGHAAIAAAVRGTGILVLAAVACTTPGSDAPDLIFTGGLVYPLGPSDAPLTALAVRGGEIVAAGSDAEIRALAGTRTQEMELEEATVLPGFHDLWVDPEALGRWDEHPLDLRLASTREEVQAILRNAAAVGPDTGWMVGWGWEESDWPDPTPPSRATLDGATERPVVLYRRTGAVGWLNTAGLREAGIDADTPEPDGGRILRDPDGSPTGILVGAALDLVERAVPAPEEPRRREWIAAGLQKLAAAGFTSVATPPVSATTAGLYGDLARRGLLPARVNLRVRPDAVGAVDPPARELLHVVAAGIDLDGPFGPRLGALSDPYADAPDERGLLTADRQAVQAAAETATSAGLELHLQARGDRAVQLALDTLGQGGVLVGMDLPPEDVVSSLTAAGLRVAVAPGRFAHEIYWLEERIGPERAARAHPWRSLVAAGVPWGMASLAPSYPLRPLAMVLAVTRRTDADGYPAGGWHPEHAVGRSFALRALAASPVDGPGLTPGRPADLVVWSENPMEADDEILLRSQPLVTVVAGRVAFSRALVDLPMAQDR